MKKNEDLKALALDELLEKKRKLKGISIGIAIPMLLIFAALIYFAIKGKNYALIAVAMGSAITLLPMFISLNAIDEEIKKRG